MWQPLFCEQNPSCLNFALRQYKHALHRGQVSGGAHTFSRSRRAKNLAKGLDLGGKARKDVSQQGLVDLLANKCLGAKTRARLCTVSCCLEPPAEQVQQMPVMSWMCPQSMCVTTRQAQHLWLILRWQVMHLALLTVLSDCLRAKVNYTSTPCIPMVFPL